MKIGIGIDTGGTCTDGVIYDLEEKKILAAAKTPTTRENLTEGIGRILDLLPAEQVRMAETIALSTTLATNACVENKGGRGRLIFLGIDRESVDWAGKRFGLPMDDTLIFIECKETLRGEILREPDWQQVEVRLKEELKNCQAAGIVELFAGGTGAALEKKTREIVERMGIPTVCGYELFQEKNVVGRGAGALLNARLIFVIAEFLKAVKEAMRQRNIRASIVIVRSDGSLMNEEISVKRPIETLLCGPVASVMGAAELHQVTEGVVVDMGGTTTDISLIRNGRPIRAEGGITVGDWRIYVKGMYVDTFGLGGDSEVLLKDGRITLGSRRVMPYCMAAARYPKILAVLAREKMAKVKRSSWRKNVYVGLKDITQKETYSEFERKVAGIFYNNPMNLVELEQEHQISLVPDNLKRLIDEGVLMPCGITPTDAMHVLGDYTGYEAAASRDALAVLGEILGMSMEETGRAIYEQVRRKLYCNIARILLWDKYPSLKKAGVNDAMESLVEGLYEEAASPENGKAESSAPERKGNGEGDSSAPECKGNEEAGGMSPQRKGFLDMGLRCEVPLIGVGGPIGVFLKDVASMFGTTALIDEYSNVANALGAIVGNVEVAISMEIQPNPEDDSFRVTGNGESFIADSLEEAIEQAASAAKELAEAEALRRGAAGDKLVFRREYEPVEAVTAYGGGIFISARVTVFAGCSREEARAVCS